MDMRYLAALIAVSTISFCPVKAFEIQEYEVNFDITEQLSVNELLRITFSEELNRTTLSYLIVGDVSDLKIDNTAEALDYIISKTENEYRVNFTIPGGTKKLLISFTSKDLVFAKDDTYQFFTVFRPPKKIEEISVNVSLPKGYVIYRDLVSPENASKITDGKRIYLTWSYANRTEEIPLSVRFYNPYSLRPLMVMVPLILAAGAAIYIVLYYRKKVKEEFFKGFLEDEVKTINFLMQKKIVYQNKIEKEFKFSRAKVTRIMKKLESKNLIERKKIGRTMKIFWKK